jgi:Lon protease-like protein
MGAPPVYPVAGLGEIGRHERLPDGRFHVQLVGLGRVRLAEQPSDRLYRKVAAAALGEVDPPPAEAKALRAALVKALAQRMATLQPLPKGIAIGRLADLLSLRLPLTHARSQELFAELDAGRRARGVLEDFRRTISAAAG